ncbi:hypothetical protein KBD33_05885 [Candidatus Gracilibacteria bacterium]|nr:hypothetical protein [Candidatus Gracilibacteria bacterium]
MKKIFVLIILISFTIGLTSCGGEKSIRHTEIQEVTKNPCLSETGGATAGGNTFETLIQQAIDRSTQSGYTKVEEISESGTTQEFTIDIGSGIPRYQKLQEEFNEIYAGKEIWSPEIQKLEKEYQMGMKDVLNGGNRNITEILIKRNMLLNTLYTSNEYLEYLKSKKEALNKINEEIKTELNIEKMK